MGKRKTAGELSLKAASDSTNYKAVEVGHALVEDGSIANNLAICAQNHRDIFDEEEYCVGYMIVQDPLIKGVMRRKFFAMLYMPSPRPEQAVFLYNKKLDKFMKRLWVLPAAYSPNKAAWTMEKLYLTDNVPKEYKTMKQWSQAFYDGVFWPFIRRQHDIKLLSEIEYLNANRQKLIEAGAQNFKPAPPDAFDFAKVQIGHINNTTTALAN